MPQRLATAAVVLGVILATGATVAPPTSANAEPKPTTFALTSQAKPGTVDRVTAHLEVGGSLKIRDEGQVRPLKMSVVADMRFEERLLAHGKGQIRSVRYYDDAKAVIKIENGVLKPTLRDDCRLMGVEVSAEDVQVFCPRGPLSRDELDLVDIQGNTLLLEALLPGEPVAIDSGWRPAADAWAGLLRLDAVSNAEVECALRKATPGKQAEVEFAGSVAGAIGGVATEINLKGRYTFDLARGRITVFALVIEEKRSIGHVGPGLDVVARLQMAIAPTATTTHLTDRALQGLPLELAKADRRVVHDSQTGGYRLFLPRSWQVVDERPEMTVARLVDRGLLLAQCNVAMPERAKPGEAISLSKFQEDIQKALGANFGSFVEAATDQSGRGYLHHRVLAIGRVNDLPIEWHYHLLAHNDGRQVVFAFTVEQELQDRFADADRQMVEGLEFLTLPEATAGQPTPATAK
jgi:hypothetical protein